MLKPWALIVTLATASSYNKIETKPSLQTPLPQVREDEVTEDDADGDTTGATGDAANDFLHYLNQRDEAGVARLLAAGADPDAPVGTTAAGHPIFPIHAVAHVRRSRFPRVPVKAATAILSRLLEARADPDRRAAPGAPTVLERLCYGNGVCTNANMLKWLYQLAPPLVRAGADVDAALRTWTTSQNLKPWTTRRNPKMIRHAVTRVFALLLAGADPSVITAEPLPDHHELDLLERAAADPTAGAVMAAARLRERYPGEHTETFISDITAAREHVQARRDYWGNCDAGQIDGCEVLFKGWTNSETGKADGCVVVFEGYLRM